MAKIAVPLDAACKRREMLGEAPSLSARVLAAADDWAVEDVICTHRPRDASFEERHARYRVALVGAGMFLCRGSNGRELMTPGSLLLGNAHECFECGHEHGAGDRCLAFGFAAHGFERLAHDAGVRGRPRFGALRVPPLASLAPLVAETSAAWAQPAALAADGWEELGVRFAAAAAHSAADPARVPRSPRNAERGVARAVLLVERDPRAALPLTVLAREAGLSRFHFLRAFARVTGLTPHQYVRRARLRRAAVKLASGDARVIDVALDCGFSDVSNFNHAFRAELGEAPLAWRARFGRGAGP